MNSNLFSLNWNDVIKSVFSAICVAAVAGLLTALGKQDLPTAADWIAIGKGAIYSGLGVLYAQITSNKEGAILKK